MIGESQSTANERHRCILSAMITRPPGEDTAELDGSIISMTMPSSRQIIQWMLLECPHSDELLTVPVDDPMGQDTFQCCECGGGFDVDWGEV